MKEETRLTVLHLSDIHIKKATSEVLDLASEIAASCYSYARRSDACLIVVTGDIAYSGNEDEYDLAAEFLEKIKNHLLNEIKSKPVYILLTPGNHDCSLLPKNVARDILIESIIDKADLANDDSVIETCTAVQKEYFEFRELITDLQPVHDTKLWTEYELIINECIIRVSSINAAWMSRIPECQGKLVFPVEMFRDFINEPASLRIALLHHPLNWYSQQSYHPLRKMLRGGVHAILSGHEHCVGSGKINDSMAGDSLYFEAQALDPENSNDLRGFSCLLWDFENQDVLEQRYNLRKSGAEPIGGEITHSLSSAHNNGDPLSHINEEMLVSLSDAGGNFTHPDKGELNAEDVFVYPELEERLADDKRVISADELSIHEEGKNILILGDDKAGKTFLLRQYYIDVLNAGKLPLYIRSCDVKTVSNRGLEKVLRHIAKEQYVSPNIFFQSPMNERVVFLDDIDRYPKGSKSKGKLVAFLEKQFGSIVITGSSSMELGELIDKDVAETLSKYETYEIRKFGHYMRMQLIRKWHMCGYIDTSRELDRVVHTTEVLIDSVLGKNLVPSSPIYLLILLQSYQSQNQEELYSSSLSYYYQYLITKSFLITHKPQPFSRSDKASVVYATQQRAIAQSFLED